MTRTVHFDRLTVGDEPLVVGAISSARTLEREDLASALRLDVAEFRLDLTGPVEGWPARARQLRDAGRPVLLTLRSAGEGGRWSAGEPERLSAYQAGLPHVSAVDVEIHSSIAADVARIAHQAGKPVILSFHDFQGLPSPAELRDLLEAGFSRGADIVKIAARTETASDVEVLRGLLRERGGRLVSTVGMGALGPASRVELALAGSCLTYGFADETNAPGQISSAAILDRLCQLGARSV